VGSDSYYGKAIKADHGVVVSVDISSLELEVPRLESLRDYVKTTLIQRLGTVATTIKNNDVAFGKFPNGVQAATLHNSYLTAVQQSYAHVVGQLDDAITATNAIIDRYRTAEARNTANVCDIDAILASPAQDIGSGAARPASVDNAGTSGGAGL
jgi:hypothetical protein